MSIFLERVRIEKGTGVFGTRVLPLAVEGWHHLLTNGLVDIHVSAFDWDNDYVVAWLDGEPVGLIVFAHQVWNKVLLVRFGYVQPQWRRMGIYQRLWEALVKDAQERKIPRISSATYLTNTAVRSLAEKQGRGELMVTLEFDMPPPAQE